MQWFDIGDPTDLDGTYAPAIAFGAPANATAPLSDFIYAGTTGGHIFVTTTGGGAGTPWKNISAGLDGSPVQFIVTNPTRGSNEAYAVTSTGVFWMPDSSIAAPVWVNITGNLFSAALTRTLFNDPGQALATLTSLTSIQADYRYAIPDNLAMPNGPTHPVLYVGGIGGVYRSLDKGVTWTYFPNMTIDGALQQGGLFPSTKVTNLALSLGNIDPVDGTPSEPYGRDMLVATTFGDGDFAIRLNDQIVVPGGNQLYTYAVSAVDGPHVVSISPIADPANPLQIDGMEVDFSGPVDPATFTPAKVNSVTGPSGTAIAVVSITDLQALNHNQYEVVFATPMTQFGFYHISLGPNISDYSGNKMDQNQNFINGENQTSTSTGDVYTGRFLFQPGIKDAPVLNLATLTAPSILENADPNPGISLPALLGTTTISDGNDISYAPPAARGIAITGVDDTNGVWQYSTNSGNTWTSLTAFGPLADTAALVLEDVANNEIRFLTSLNYNSTSTPPAPTFTFRAWDLTTDLSGSGGDNSIVDASTNGGNTAYSGTFATVTLAVNKDTSSTTLTSSRNPSQFGQTVTFTATVTPNPLSSGTPGGLVTFMDGAAALGTGAVTATTVGVNAVQTLTFAPPALNSTFTLTYTPSIGPSESTNPITYQGSNAVTQANIQAELDNLFGVNNALVGAPIGNAFTITFPERGWGTLLRTCSRSTTPRGRSHPRHWAFSARRRPPLATRS